MQITLDRQVVSYNCPECMVSFSVIRGQIFDAGIPVGLYLIGLRGHYEGGRMAKLAIALLVQKETGPHAIAIAMDVLEMSEQISFSVTDWSQSPWKDETYLGEMLNRTAALSSPQIEHFFHAADHIIGDLPEVQAYFG
jgi:hypothetical protein